MHRGGGPSLPPAPWAGRDRAHGQTGEGQRRDRRRRDRRGGVLKLIGKTRAIADGQLKRKPVRDYLLRQGRFAHFTDDDFDYFQSKVDEMWERWLIPGVIPFRKQIEADPAPA